MLLASAVLAIVLLVSGDARDRLGFGDADDPLVLSPCTPSPDQIERPAAAPVAGRWRVEPPLPVSRDELRAVRVGRMIAILGGHRRGPDGRLRSTGAVWLFDPRSGRYARGPALPRPLDHADALADGGTLYVVGGFSNYRARAEVWSLRLEARRWRLEGRIRTPRGAHAAGIVDGKLYVAAGAPPTLPDPDVAPYAAVEELDLETGRSRRLPDIPTPRHHVGAATAGGALYVVGGRAPHDFSLATTERFDPRRGEWERLPELPLGVGGTTLSAVGGSLVAVAGGDDRERWVTPATWLLRPGASRWERLPDLGIPRHGHAAAAVGRRVYVFGGAPCAGFGRTASVQSLEIPR